MSDFQMHDSDYLFNTDLVNGLVFISQVSKY